GAYLVKAGGVELSILKTETCWMLYRLKTAAIPKFKMVFTGQRSMFCIVPPKERHLVCADGLFPFVLYPLIRKPRLGAQETGIARRGRGKSVVQGGDGIVGAPRAGGCGYYGKVAGFGLWL